MSVSHTTNESEGTLADHLDPSIVRTQVSIASKKKLLEYVANLLGDEEPSLYKKIFHSLIERERLGSTGIGEGVALPHGRCDDIEGARLCIVTLSQAIDYDSIDHKPVNVIFGLAVPTEAKQQHLEMLASIANLLRQEEVCQQLLSYSQPEDVITFIRTQFS